MLSQATDSATEVLNVERSLKRKKVHGRRSLIRYAIYNDLRGSAQSTYT